MFVEDGTNNGSLATLRFGSQLCSATFMDRITYTTYSQVLSSIGRYSLRPISATAIDLDGLPMFMCLILFRISKSRRYVSTYLSQIYTAHQTRLPSSISSQFSGSRASCGMSVLWRPMLDLIDRHTQSRCMLGVNSMSSLIQTYQNRFKATHQWLRVGRNEIKSRE